MPNSALLLGLVGNAAMARKRFATKDNGVCNGHEHARQFVLEPGVIDHKVEVVVRSGHESADGYVAKDGQWFRLLSLSQRCVGCYEAAPSGRCR